MRSRSSGRLSPSIRTRKTPGATSRSRSPREDDEIARFASVNRPPAGGVLRVDEPMHDRAARLAGDLVTVDRDLDREFEVRLTESSTLAFRVAYGVLRHRQDAEDVAQEAFV